jgi:dTMP kinase
MAIGKFIIFEGNEGTGKSTHIQYASDYLKRCKIECIVTREPGGTAFGESVRDILLDANSKLDSVSEAVLFYASRVYNYNNVILKALLEGKYVICDRFHYSTLVYQGISQSNNEVIELHNVLDKYFAKNISLIFHLDASINTSFSRIKERDVSDKFEKQGKEFLIKIKEAYLEVFKNNTKAVNISTDGDKNDVEKLIKKYLDKLINE